MDDMRLKQLLDDIAHDEIGNEMNLWPEIQAELQSKRKRSRSRFARLGGFTRLVAAVLIFTLAGAIGFALYQTTLDDPSIPDENITTLNTQETQDGVTVTLHWAYADEHRITIVWSEEYSGELLVGSANATLQTTDGTVLPPAFGGGGGGSGGGEGATVRGESMMTYDASSLDLAGRDSIYLILTVEYSGAPPVRGGSGGGGGGSSSGESVPTALPPTIPPVATMGASTMVTPTFRFAFSVPVIPAETYAVEAVQGEADGFPMTMSDIRLTPSLAKFTVCSPAFLQDVTETEAFFWKPVVIITTDTDTQGIGVASNELPTTTEDGSACYEMRVLQDFSGVESFTLAVPYLVQRPINLGDVTEADVAEEERFFAEMGIDVQFNVSQYGFGTEYADLNAVTDFQRLVVSLLAFTERMDGGWSFEATR